MYRMNLAIACVAFLAGCPSVAQHSGSSAPEQVRTPTPAELALEGHRQGLLATPGVLEVVVVDEGRGLHASLCAESAARGVRDREVGVPLTYSVAPAPLPSTCGCSHEGRYYRPSESYSVGCNTCRCAELGQATCTLLACDVSILSKVLFPLNSSELDATGRAVAVTVVDILRRHATMRVQIRGHAAPNEATADDLSAARAAAVRDFLIAERVDAGRLEMSAVGAAVPLFSNPAKERRDPAVLRVSFDVIAP